MSSSHKSPSNSQSGWTRTLVPLRDSNFRAYWMGVLFYFLAININGVARGWLAWQMTGKASFLGFISLCWGLPVVLISLYAGAIADRVDKRKVALRTQALILLAPLAIALLLQTDTIQIWQLAVIALMEGVVYSFNIPARMAWVPELVSEDDLMSSMALNSGAMQATLVVGPALAALCFVLPFVGMTGTFYLIAASHFVALLLIRFTHSTHVSFPATGEHVLKQMLEAAGYVASNARLRLLLGLAFLVLCLGSPFITLLPVFAGERVFDVGSRGFAVMAAVAGVGATAGAFAVGSWPHLLGRGRVQFLAGMAVGVGLFVFGLVQHFAIALLLLLLLGLTSTGYSVITSTLILAYADRRFHGRVMSIYILVGQLVWIVTMPIAAAADLVGVQKTVMVLGAALAVALAALRFGYAPYRRFDKPESTVQVELEEEPSSLPRQSPPA